MLQRIRAVLLIGATLFSTPLNAQGPAGDFKPDTVFSGSGLGAWTVVGDGAWTVEKGEVSGKAGAGGSWLVLDRPYQDLYFFTQFQCAAPCDAGVLFRVQQTPAGRGCSRSSASTTTPSVPSAPMNRSTRSMPSAQW